MHRENAHRLAGMALAICLSGLAGSVLAQTPADNTKVNTRDRSEGAVTADPQRSPGPDTSGTN